MVHTKSADAGLLVLKNMLALQSQLKLQRYLWWYARYTGVNKKLQEDPNLPVNTPEFNSAYPIGSQMQHFLRNE
jgi:hypothetical protein